MRKRSPDEWDAEFSESAKIKRSQATSDRYFWDDDVRRRRFETVTFIAAWWAEKEGLRTVKEFDLRFREEVAIAVPAAAKEYRVGDLLSATATSVKNDNKPSASTSSSTARDTASCGGAVSRAAV